MPKQPETLLHLPAKMIKRILITQPKPEGSKSPYFDLALKYNLTLDFFPLLLLKVSRQEIFENKKLTSRLLPLLSSPAEMPLIIFFAFVKK